MTPKREGLKLKSLLTRPNLLLLVRVRHKGKRLTIPVPLWTLEEFLRALRDLTWIWERIFRVWARHKGIRKDKKWLTYLGKMPFSAAIDLGVELIRDLRRSGRFRIVEIEDRDLLVYIDLF